MCRWGFWDGRTGREGSVPTPMAPFPLFRGEMIRIMGYTRRERERAFSFSFLSASSNEDLEVRAAASLASASEEENDCGRKGGDGGRSSAARVFYSLRCRRSLTTFFESAAFRHRRRCGGELQNRDSTADDVADGRTTNQITTAPSESFAL